MTKRATAFFRFLFGSLLTTFTLTSSVPSPGQESDAQFRQEWYSLNEQVRQAGNVGDEATALQFALKALQLGRDHFGAKAPLTLGSMQNVALFYSGQGHFDQAEPLAREAATGMREVLGDLHPDTLACVNILAVVLQNEGRYSEAEPLFQEVLQGRKQTLGALNRKSLASLDNLAGLYERQGRYTESEKLLREAHQKMVETLGDRDPDTLINTSELGLLLHSEGRYGEAEPFLKQAATGRRELYGPLHPETLASINNLAFLYRAQHRYDEAEQILLPAVQSLVQSVGPTNPRTIASKTNLAAIYSEQGRFGDAETLYREVLQARRQLYGPRHQQSLNSLRYLGNVLVAQARYDEAEPLYHEALDGLREVAGPRNPDTITVMRDFASLELIRGLYDKAEPLYREAAQASREIMGPRHPNSLAIQLGLSQLLVNKQQHAEAVRLLQQIETNLLIWLGQELYSTQAGDARRLLVSSQAHFQDVVLSLAIKEPSNELRRLAGNTILHFKLLQGDEEAYLARLVRRSQDPRIIKLATDVKELRSALIAASRGSKDAFESLLQALEAKQLELGALSRDYKDHLRVVTSNIDDLQAVLPSDAVFMEFRKFQPIDFRTNAVSAPRFAVLLLTSSAEPIITEIGTETEIRELMTKNKDESDVALYRQLFGKFDRELASASSVYVAPDGILNLFSLSKLKLSDGRYWIERQEVQVLETGRPRRRGQKNHMFKVG